MPIDEFCKIDEDYFSTILEDDFFFDGNLKIDDSLIVKGNIKGTIETTGLIVVAPGAFVDADIRSKNIQCFGKITGNIFVEEEAYFHSPSIVSGDISTPVITIEKGCVINGKINMKK